MGREAKPEIALRTASWGGPCSSWEEDDDGFSLWEQLVRVRLAWWKSRPLMVLNLPPLSLRDGDPWILNEAQTEIRFRWMGRHGSVNNTERRAVLHAISGPLSLSQSILIILLGDISVSFLNYSFFAYADFFSVIWALSILSVQKSMVCVVSRIWYDKSTLHYDVVRALLVRLKLSSRWNCIVSKSLSTFIGQFIFLAGFFTIEVHTNVTFQFSFIVADQIIVTIFFSLKIRIFLRIIWKRVVLQYVINTIQNWNSDAIFI